MAKKPLPAAYLCVVCFDAGHERRPVTMTQVLVRCQDCGAAICAYAEAIAEATADRSRRGRPIAFLCGQCFGGYDCRPGQIVDRTHDRRFTR